MGERTSWYTAPVVTEDQRNSEGEDQLLQRVRGTVDLEDQRTRRKVGTEDQWVQGTRGTVGTED